jgi:hypothetical protein
MCQYLGVVDLDVEVGAQALGAAPKIKLPKFETINSTGLVLQG